jgi:hypothetical protein
MNQRRPHERWVAVHPDGGFDALVLSCPSGRCDGDATTEDHAGGKRHVCLGDVVLVV